MTAEKKPIQVSKDETFLRAFLAKGGQAHTQGGTPVSSVSHFLAQGGGDPDDESTQASATRAAEETHEELEPSVKSKLTIEEAKAEAIRQKTAEKQQASASAEEERQKKLAAAQAASDQRQRAEGLQQAKHATSTARQAVDSLLSPFKGTADRIASARTPGGIGLLLVMIFILLFTVVPVNPEGDTRFKQIWYALNGRASLQGREELTAGIGATETIQQDIANLGSAISAFDASAQQALEQIPVIGGIYDLYRALPGSNQ